MCDARTTDSKIISSATTTPFSNTYLTLYVNQISDSAFIQVEHNWVAPDPFKTGIPGLYLTDKRYWKVEGILPDTFNITTRFLYSVATTGSYAHLDYGFLTDPPDSLALLYRKNTADDWHITNAYKQGASTNGYLTLDTLMIGEYAFGMWHRVAGINDSKKKDSGKIKIYPNPTNDNFYFEQQNNDITNFKIFDVSGKMVLSGQLKGKCRYQWQPPATGNFIAVFLDNNGKIIERQEIVASK